MTTAARSPHPFESLEPDVLLGAVESVGLPCDGRILALNSYENRVYQLGLASGGYVVAKFYRPERWSEAIIREELAFTCELAAAEIPVAAPIADANGETLHEYGGFRFSVCPRIAGRTPELDSAANLRTIGRMLGRMHAIGALRRFQHRPGISIAELGEASYQLLLEGGHVPHELARTYRQVAEVAIDACRNRWDSCEPLRRLRLHGDCHPSNVLWTDMGPCLVDFDDCRNGPAIQDMWMFLSGDHHAMGWQLAQVLRGYREFFDFNWSEVGLVEALRTLRMIHYSAWLAQRWSDPAFPRTFVWFGGPNYWREQITNLEEQTRRLDEAPIDPFAYIED